MENYLHFKETNSQKKGQCTLYLKSQQVFWRVIGAKRASWYNEQMSGQSYLWMSNDI